MPYQQRTIYLLSRLNHAIRQRVDEVLREHGLTAAQYTVLSLLRGRERLSLAEIARRFSVKPQSMNPVIFALEDKSLITRAEDPVNRRILRVSLTASGRRLLEACDDRIDVLESRLLSGVGATRLSQLRDTLSGLLERARSEAETGVEEPPAQRTPRAARPPRRAAPGVDGAQQRRGLKRAAGR